MGLGCVQAAGGWTKVRRLDLPAVLKLAGPDGKPHWAALVALEEDKVSLAFGPRVAQVARTRSSGYGTAASKSSGSRRRSGSELAR